ncbi:VOC family protein [Agromyces sp. MMS24-K17]|uniref:VOC family protein n=1 Tax=Agromyces sp. MMS24-K17 TaxID=3372850 RepID=UPI00375425F0
MGLQAKGAFPGFSVDDVDAAREFYSGALGLAVDESMGGLWITLPSGQGVFVYGKPNHEPASFTILNFEVDDLDAAVDALNAAGVSTKIYEAPNDFGTDSRGIAHGTATGDGPDICWFRDPAGNVLSLIAA